MVKLSREFYRRISKIGLKNRWEKEHAKVNLNKKLTKEKVAIHSYLCGDGWIAIRKSKKAIHYEIRVAPDDAVLAEFIVDLFKKEFNIEPKIEIKKNYFCVRIKNKPACLSLLSLGPCGTYEWKIPKNLSKNLLVEWIKCFFDCESSVDVKNKKISLKSVNFQGLLDIQDKLRLFNIDSRVYGPYKQKNEKHTDYGILLITGKNIRRYQRLINFHHSGKSKKLEQL